MSCVQRIISEGLRNGLKYYYNKVIKSIPFEFFRNNTKKDLDRNTLYFYGQFIKTGDLCFDIGANIGKRTDIFLALGARSVCVDPQPKCIEILKGKYSHNSRVSLVQKGLATGPGIMPFFLCESAPTISTFSDRWKTGRFRDYQWNSKVDVQVTTLDSLIAEFGMPNFCKIDVEGFEYQVIGGLSRPIPALSFEFTKEFLKEAKLCMDHLVRLGFLEFNYTFGESFTFALADWKNADTAFDSLVLIDDELMWGDIYARSPSFQ